MSTPAHSTTAEVAAPMPRTAEPEQAAADSRRALVRGGAAIGRRALQQLGENPLQALFGTAIVALLIFNFTSTSRRIDDTNDRITRLEQRMDARFAALEEDIDKDISALKEDISALREDVTEINLKLTALIAALNQTDEVAAAIEGRLIEHTPDAGPAGTPDPAETPCVAGAPRCSMPTPTGSQMS